MIDRKTAIEYFRLAKDIHELHLSVRDKDILDNVIQAWEAVLNLEGISNFSDIYLSTLINICQSHLKRYDLKSEFSDLDNAIHYARIAIDVPADSHDRSFSYYYLGVGLYKKFLLYRKFEDINESKISFNTAIELDFEYFPNPGYLSDLALALCDGYTITFQLSDLDEAVSISERAVNGTPEDSVDRPNRLNTLGNVLKDRSRATGRIDDLERAIVAYKQAIEISNPKSEYLPIFLSNLGYALADLFSFTRDIQSLEEARANLEKAVELSQDNKNKLPHYLNILATIYHARFLELGNPDNLREEMKLLETAIQETPVTSKNRPGYLSNLGNSYRLRYLTYGDFSDLEKSISLYKEAIDFSSLIAQDLAEYKNNLANVLNDRYEITHNITDLEESITLTRELLELVPYTSTDRPLYMNNLGLRLYNSYKATNNFDQLKEAIRLIEESLEKFPKSVFRPGYLNNLGNAYVEYYRHSNDIVDLKRAIQLLRDSVVLTQECSPSFPSRLLNLGNGLVNYFQKSKDLTYLVEAIQFFTKALRLSKPDSITFLYLSYALAKSYVLRYIHSIELFETEQISDVKVDNQFSEIDRLTDLKNAFSIYLNVCEKIDEMYILSPVSYKLGPKYNLERIFSDAIITVVLLESKESDYTIASEYKRIAFLWIEKIKSRVLSECLSRMEVPPPLTIPIELINKERAFLQKLGEIETNEMVNLNTSGEFSFVNNIKIRKVLVHQLNELWATIDTFGDDAQEYTSSRRNSQLTWEVIEELCQRLGPESLIVSFYHLDEQTMMFIFRYGWPVPILIKSAINFRDTLDRYSWEIQEFNNIETANLKGETWDRPLISLLNEGMCYFNDVDRIFFVPHKFGHSLPWGTLVNKIGLDTSIIVLPGLNILPKLLGRSASNETDSLVLGDPVGDLPNSLNEAKLVAKLLKTKPLLGSDATKEKVLKSLSSAKFIHFATHGKFIKDSPLDSYVVLADGNLTAREILQSRLNADLIILSACETGQTASLGGEEFAGLKQSILLAGARSMVLGLWEVNDSASTTLMQKFYQNLLNSPDKAKALHQAMIEMKNGRNFNHTHYWGAFEYIGI